MTTDATEQGPQVTKEQPESITPAPVNTPETASDQQTDREHDQDTPLAASIPPTEAGTPVPIYAPLISKRPTSETDDADQEQNHGPVWSASEAARRCKVGRATITRKLQAGAIPGATKDEDGFWQIPLSGLLAAGFHPDRPAPPEGDNADQGTEVIAAKLAEVEKELAAERGRREAMEKTSEQIAELHRKLAAEKDKRIEDLQNALRMIEAPKPAQTDQPKATAPSQPTQAPETQPQQQGIAGKLRQWLSSN